MLFFLSSYCICSLEVEAERKSGWKFAVQGLSHEYERMTKLQRAVLEQEEEAFVQTPYEITEKSESKKMVVSGHQNR